MTNRIRLCAIIVLLAAGPSGAGDADELEKMLHTFLAGAGDAAVHDRFWAEDLIYTSSRGTRTNKAAIMAGFDVADETDAPDAAPFYTAEDIQIQVYGTTAIVAFRLVATQPAGNEVLHYLNTGTFLRRDGRWQAVAWQATRIPDA